MTSREQRIIQKLKHQEIRVPVGDDFFLPNVSNVQDSARKDRITSGGLTASRLVQTNASSVLASVADLTNWIAGTTNRITVTGDGDGTLTLTTPQDTHTSASPTFVGATLSGLTSNRILYSSSGVITDDAGLTFNSGTDTLTLGANHIYTQGAHGFTMAADDFAVGSGTANRMQWDNSASQLIINNAAGANAIALGGNLAVGDSTYIWIMSRARFGYDNAVGGIAIDDNTANKNLTITLNSNKVFKITSTNGATEINYWVNVGTTTSAAAQGDFSAGLTGNAYRIFYDQSAATFDFFDNAGNVTHRIHANGATVFNENSVDIDFRIESNGDANCLFVDGGANNVGIGTGTPAASAKLDITSTTGALLLPRMTTTQRDALTPANGMMIYNTSNNVIEGYENGAWVNL